MGKVFKKMAVGFVMFIALVLLGAFTLVLYQEYSGRLPDEMLNDVFCGFAGTRDAADGALITCIEQQNVSTNPVLKIRDVCSFTSLRSLQTYRIENKSVWDVRCLNYRDLDKHAICKEFGVIHEEIKQLPNILEQEKDSPLSLNNNKSVSVIDIYYSSSRLHNESSMPPNRILWHGWKTLKWAGVPDEVPVTIKTFCRNAILAASLPSQSCVDDYEKLGFFTRRAAIALPDIENYPAYLRAVPLFTEKELEAEKDTPLIDLDTTRKNVQYAVRFPCVLFPIPPKRSPFPSVRKYTAGDKFKVNDENGCFLIETFVNGSLVKETKKGELQ